MTAESMLQPSPSFLDVSRSFADECGTSVAWHRARRCHCGRRSVPRPCRTGLVSSPAHAGCSSGHRRCGSNRSRPRMRSSSTRPGSQGRGTSSARSHAGAEDVSLVAPGASDRAVAIGADVQMPGVVIARHRSTDGALPTLTRPSALRARQRLRLCHFWIVPSRYGDREASGELPRPGGPAVCPGEFSSSAPR